MFVNNLEPLLVSTSGFLFSISVFVFDHRRVEVCANLRVSYQPPKVRSPCHQHENNQGQHQHDYGEPIFAAPEKNESAQRCGSDNQDDSKTRFEVGNGDYRHLVGILAIRIHEALVVNFERSFTKRLIEIIQDLPDREGSSRISVGEFLWFR